MQGEARCPQPTSGKAARSPAYGCAGSIASAASRWQLRSADSRAPKAQRRYPPARRAAARRRARVPSRTRAGAPPRRPRSRQSPPPSHASPVGNVPRIRRESTRMPRVRRTRSRPSSRAIRTSAPATKGARPAAVATYLPLSRTIASDPSPVVRYANDTAQDATASQLGGRWTYASRSSVRWAAAVHIRFARRGAVFGGRPLACSRSRGNHQFGS